MFQKALLGFIIILMPALLQATTDLGKPYVTITDIDIEAGGHLYLDNSTNWVLDGFVYVEDGAHLEIQEGTVIKGELGQASGASALIISRGGYLTAVGTPENPIIFTSVRDTVYDIFDIDLFNPDSARGLWGGVILLGRAATSESNGIDSIEGIPGDAQSRHFYGGGLTPNDNDSSCNMQYVSIRHGGTDIGAANEINGLTMGAIGCNSIIRYVEVAFNNDDGFEFFGGCPNTDHLAVVFCRDDSYDYDEGYRGTGQFWFTIQTSDAGDRGGEHDGGDDTPGALPYATPIISNVTYFGRGIDAASEKHALMLRDNAGGAYYNSIFADYSKHGPTIDDNHCPTDSRNRMFNDLSPVCPETPRDEPSTSDLKIYNNLWDDFKYGSNGIDPDDPVALCNGDDSVAYQLFDVWSNEITDLGIAYGSRLPYTYDLDPRPKTGFGSFIWSNPVDVDTAIGFHPELAHSTPPDTISIPECWGQMEVVDYPGAFDPNQRPWVADWTLIDQYGYLYCCETPGDVGIPEDGSVLVNDIVWLVDFLFKGGPAPSCAAEGDVSVPKDGSILVNDIVWLVDFLFKGGPAPADC